MAEQQQAPAAPSPTAPAQEVAPPTTYASDFERLKAQPVKVNMREIYAGKDQSFETYDGRTITLSINMLNAVLPEAFRFAEKEEAATFVHYCATNRLDPFRKQVYFIKYSASAPAAFVTSWTVFIDRANRNPMFDGFESGIVWHIKQGDEIKVVRGQPCDYMPDDTHVIAGGWAIAYRKDQSHPRKVEVPLGEMQAKRRDQKTGKIGPTKMWSDAETTMCTKTPSARAIRLLFPDDLGGLLAEGEQREVPMTAPKDSSESFREFLKTDKPPEEGIHDAPAAEAPKPQGTRRKFGP